MNQTIVNSLCFGTGVAAGIIFTSIYWKKKMDKILAEELDYIRPNSDEFSEPGVEVNPPRADGPLSEEDRNEIREKLVRNFEQTSSYATMYKDAAEEEHPVDSDEDDDVEDELDRINEEHRENFNKPPKIISAEEFSNLPPQFETDALYFYHYDDVLVDDEDDEIDDPGVLIGDCLDKYGFRDSDEEIIFVINYRIDKAFEIHRVMGSWHNGNPTID